MSFLGGFRHIKEHLPLLYRWPARRAAIFGRRHFVVPLRRRLHLIRSYAGAGSRKKQGNCCYIVNICQYLLIWGWINTYYVILSYYFSFDDHISSKTLNMGFTSVPSFWPLAIAIFDCSIASRKLRKIWIVKLCTHVPRKPQQWRLTIWPFFEFTRWNSGMGSTYYCFLVQQVG